MAGAQIRKGVHVDLREDDFAFPSSKGEGVPLQAQRVQRNLGIWDLQGHH